MSQTRCSHCREIGHNIKTCPDPNVENAWKFALRCVDLRMGSRLTDEDFVELRAYLDTLSRSMVRVLGVQIGDSLVRDPHSAQIAKIIAHITCLAIAFTEWDFQTRQSFLLWMDPEGYERDQENEEDQEDEEDTESEDSDDFLWDRDEWIPEVVEEEIVPSKRVETIVFCLESARELTEVLECPICFDSYPRIEMDTTQCNHSFCHTCVKTLMEKTQCHPNCPMCRTLVRTITVRETEKYEDIEWLVWYHKPIRVFL